MPSTIRSGLAALTTPRVQPSEPPAALPSLRVASNSAATLPSDVGAGARLQQGKGAASVAPFRRYSVVVPVLPLPLEPATGSPKLDTDVSLHWVETAPPASGLCLPRLQRSHNPSVVNILQTIYFVFKIL